MRVLVIPDVHLKPQLFDLAEEVPASKYDAIVCLGDIADDWNADIPMYQKTYARALAFAEKHKDQLYWCYGNHDISYMYASVGLTFAETGFNDDAALITDHFLKSLKLVLGDRLGVIFKFDEVLFSHAGLSEMFVEDYLYCSLDDSIEDIIDRTNSLVDAQLIRTLWNDYSPIWVRPQHSYIDMVQPYLHVVGHTPVLTALHKENVLTLDLFSTYSNGESIGDREMFIVDTDEKSYRTVAKFE